MNSPTSSRTSMPVICVFNGLKPGLRKGVVNYWAAKHRRLERLLKRFPAEQRELRLTLHRRARPTAWEVRGVLRLPTGTLVAAAFEPRLKAALDRVAATLTLEAGRHKARLRKSRLAPRFRLSAPAGESSLGWTA